ncbi:hypothetical protein [Enterovibrio norvegicus]|uniref:KfrA N-terminal DNA-binding domain-containing protein n=1 Tax=Enterovibrio norvegicus FF-454 TaxID=1185651 RepID=A0A1E5CAI2_9GAMM|nr:hypothetical protein [Enterovibrio norvegicus]OEE62427.1 hypothetical protein A1OK_07695 [Enterovibrio norvegicus FF-454]OEE74332.1 hypothetical protein A1OQ_09560 [Enterovibrio norvegicus FF-162]
MSTDFTPALQQAIEALLREGKEPTVALVKSRLNQSVPMPLIISALQRWKKNGKVPKIEIIEKVKDADARIEALEAQVRVLTQRLDALEQHSKNNSES